ncbi:tRNA epoxyqueuosine(34) reductase QueG [Gammaproteobacteria bacterium]|jgi:epoxyqueuosine reductase|nr:tRNA epoxyqueuosine(34) reductase QueG [Gammaproteobacteria bacterium]|tara:strand:+ start:1785 stop:2834 length:1050 start_codon:yes stop_codon:yes gene_type:complete
MKLELLKNKIIEWGDELGFDGVGFTDIDLKEDETHLLNWLENKFHGEMHYMEKHGIKRSQPDKLMPGAVRVISFRMNYLQDNTYDSKKVLENKNLAYISRYALGKDYHSEMRDRLHIIAKKINQEVDGFKYRAFVDSAPVLEKAIGQKSGLGWIGKNTLLINKKNGSYFFLGEIYTNIDFDIDKKSKNFCGQCSECIDKCPTNAIISPNVLDAKKCIAYLTIELKGSIPNKYRDSIGNRIFGCDDCQLVCPWNRFSEETRIEEFTHKHELDSPTLISLFNWTEKEFKENTKNTPINRISYFQWLRNISIGLGNAEKNNDIIQILKNKKNNITDPILNEHIDWAIKKQTN